MWERAFGAITWCPKATVQAALSTVALDYVEENLDLWTGQEQADQLRFQYINPIFTSRPARASSRPRKVPGEHFS